MSQPHRSGPNQPVENAVPGASAVVAQRVRYGGRVASPESRGHGRPNSHAVARRRDRFAQSYQLIGLVAGQHILIGANDARNAGRIERRFDFLRFGVGAHEHRHGAGAKAGGHEPAHFYRDRPNGQRGAVLLGDAVPRRVVLRAHPHPLQRARRFTQEGVGHHDVTGRRDLRHSDQRGTAGERLRVVPEQLRNATHHGIGAAKVREQRVAPFDSRGRLEIGVYVGVSECEDGLLRVADE